MQTLEELIKQLPPELRQEVRDFVEFLLDKQGKKTKPRIGHIYALRKQRIGHIYEVKEHGTEGKGRD